MTMPSHHVQRAEALQSAAENADYLRALIADASRLRATVEDGRREADSLIARIKHTVTPAVGIGMLHTAALAEMSRNAQLSKKTTPSDLCGQARFLRGVVTSCTLDPDGVPERGPAMDTARDTILRCLEELWRTLFFVERLQAELVQQTTSAVRSQVDDANMAWSYGRTDIDMGYVAPVHDRCREVFGGLDNEFVRPTFGIGVERMLQGFSHLQEAMQSRMGDAVRQQREDPSPERSVVLGELLASCLEFSTSDLPGDWPESERAAFFATFSMSSGQHPLNRPGDDNPCVRHPFLRLSRDRFLLMDPIFCPYAPMRLLTHTAESAAWRARYLKQRDRVFEERAGRLLAEATAPFLHLRGVFLPVGKNGDLAEQDHIIIADGAAFFVECKAKRVRSPVVHEGNVAKVRDDMKASVQVAFEQADRARRHVMEATADVPVFDQHGRETGRIKRGAIQTAHAVVATWESLCPLSIDLTPWLSVDPGTEYPWVVWVDDLQTALTRLRPAAKIAGYITWRSSLQGRLFSGDEMPVVGCFLAGHTKIPAGKGIVAIDQSYAHIFDDDFFASNGVRREAHRPQTIPTIVELTHVNGVPSTRSVSTNKCSTPSKSPKRRFKQRKRR